MRHVRGRALGAGAQLGHLHGAVVGSAHPLAAVRWLAFGNSHILSCVKISICSIRTRPTKLPPGWRLSFHVLWLDWAIPRNRPHTTDVADTPKEYLPAGTASSPPNHL